MYNAAADLIAAGGAATAKRLAEWSLAAAQLELYGGPPAADDACAAPRAAKKRKNARGGGASAGDDLPDAAAAAAAVAGRGPGAGDPGDLAWAGGRQAARDAAVQTAALRLLEALLQVGVTGRPSNGAS